jgi:hypothetical protein
MEDSTGILSDLQQDARVQHYGPSFGYASCTSTVLHGRDAGSECSMQ